MVSAGLARDWAFLLSYLWRGGSSPSDLCSAAALYAVQLPFPGLCRGRGFSASSCPPIPWHRIVPGPEAPGRAGAVVGAEGAFT